MGDYRICRLSDGKYYTLQANQLCTEGQEETGQGAPPPPPATPASPAPAVVGGPEAKPKVVPKTPEDPIAKVAREAGEQFDRGVPTPPAAGTPKAPAPGAAAPAPGAAPAKPAQKRPAKEGEIAELFTAAIHLVNKGIKVKVKEGLDIDEKYKTNSRKKNIPVRRAVASLDNKVELTTTLNALYAALYSNQNSKYDLTAVLAILKEKGLTLAQIAQLAKLKGLSGDDLIEALLKELKETPLKYETSKKAATAKFDRAIEFYQRGNYEDALELLQEALKFAIEKKLNTSNTYYNIGNCHLMLGDLAEAKQAYQAAYKGASKEDIPDIKVGLEKVAKRGLAIEKERKEISGYAAHLRYVVFEIPPDKLSAVAQYISQTAPKQRLITFNADGRTYSALIEEKDGKWQLVTPTHKKYYLKIENNNPVVYQKTGMFSSLRLATTPVTPSEVQPEGGSQRREAYAILRRITNGSLTRADFDKIWKNGKIDKEAAKKLFKDYLGGKEKLYVLVSNLMNADATEGSDIDLAKLRKFDEVISFWAKQLGMDEKQIANAFISSDSFCMVDRNEIGKTGEDIRNKLSDITKDNMGEKLSGYPPKVVAEVTRYFADNKDIKINGKSVSAYLLRFPLASMTGLYETFDIKDRSIFAGMPAYRSASLNKESVAAWFAGRAVTEQTPPRFGAGGSEPAEAEKEFDMDEFFRESMKKEPKFREIYRISVDQQGSAVLMTAVHNYMTELKGSGRLSQLEKFFKFATENTDPRRLINGLKTDIGNPPYSGAINIMYEAYTATRDPIMYDRAFALLKNLPNGPEKHKLLVELSLKYLGLKTSEADRRRAIEVLREINVPNYFQQKDNANFLREFQLYGVKVSEQHTMENLISAVEAHLEMPHDIFIIRQSVIVKEGQHTLSQADEAIKKLKAIIEKYKTNSEVDIKMRAYAQLVMAEVLRAQADSDWKKSPVEEPGKKAKPKSDVIAKYKEMAETARKSVYLFIALENYYSGRDERKVKNYMGKYIEANSLIAQVIARDEICSIWQPKERNPRKQINDHGLRDYYQREFKDMAKYIKTLSTVEFERQNAPQTYDSRSFKNYYFNEQLPRDDEHKNKPIVVVGKEGEINLPTPGVPRGKNARTKPKPAGGAPKPPVTPGTPPKPAGGAPQPAGAPAAGAPTAAAPPNPPAAGAPAVPRTLPEGKIRGPQAPQSKLRDTPGVKENR